MALVTILGVGFGVNASMKILSASVELMSHQPSPFANLESLKIYPKRFRIGLKDKVDISAEVKNYLLDGSRSATFTIISREREFLISDLGYLLLDGHNHVNFSGDDFNSLEKVDICIDHPSKKEPQTCWSASTSSQCQISRT
nr:F-box domain, leucine-rich repeat domain, L domain-like protein [Tanacetum cinerariifolium]